MSAFLEAALSSYRHGFSLIPIVPRDKKPLIMWEKYQSTPATEEELNAWWSKWPDANVGIVTGKISGLVVIDLDNEEAKNKLKEMLPGYDLMAVPRSRTGKGWQLFFRHPGTSIQNRAGIIPGLDVRGDGGYVVAPPSIHPNGKVYKWQVPLTGELPKLPVDLFKLISSPTGNGLQSTAKVDPVGERIKAGERNSTLASLAGTMRRRGMGEDAILAALLKENESKCDPPLLEREVEQIAGSVVKYQPEQRTAVGKETKSERSPVVVRLSDVQREEVSWLWQDRIPIGKLTLFDGDPGVGKSWLTLAIATAVTRGSPLPQDMAREPGKVMLLTAEDGLGDTVRPRLEDMGANLDLVNALKGMRDEKGQERSLTLADIDVLEATLKEHGPSLVVVDPVVAYVAGRDTWKASEVRGLLAPLAALAEKYRCAVIGVRHLTKQSMKAIYRGQGSIDFLAACRSAFLVAENPDNPDQRVICHLKSNLAPRTPSLTFTVKEGRFLWGEVSNLTAEQVLATPAGTEDKSEQDEAKEFLRDLLSEGPLPSSEVKKQSKEAGIAERTLWRAKTALGVKAVKGGFQEGWNWSLPPEACQKDSKAANSEGLADLAHFGNLGSLRDSEEGWEEV